MRIQYQDPTQIRENSREAASSFLGELVKKAAVVIVSAAVVLYVVKTVGIPIYKNLRGETKIYEPN